MALTVDRLRSLGVSQTPEFVEALLYRAIAQAVDPHHSAEPHKELTTTESAVLKRGGVDPVSDSQNGEDPLLATAVEYAALVATAFSVGETATLLDVQPDRIRRRVRARTLYGIRDAKVWRLPRFQFANGQTVPGFGRVLAAIPSGIHPVAFARWFTMPDTDLVVGPDEICISPRKWLIEGGDVNEVARLAAEL